ncbi:hypothetical protein, partial [Ornithinimicrobium sufpigmenti]
MDAPPAAALPGPGAGWSAAEQRLIGYAQLDELRGDLRGATAVDLAALAERRARWALQVSPVPALVRIQVEISPLPTAGDGPEPEDADADAGPGSGEDTAPSGGLEPSADSEPVDLTESAAPPVDTEATTQDQSSTAGQAAAGGTVPVPHVSVVAVDAAARARCGVEADLLEAAAEVVDECRARILNRRGLTGVSLSPAAARSVDAAVRQAAVMELDLATGTSTTEATTLTAVATCGGELRSMLLAALRRGQARWGQVKTFWERTTRAHLTH